MTIHRTPLERKMEEQALELKPLRDALEKVRNLYDAITAVQADETAMTYVTQADKGTLTSAGTRMDRVGDRIAGDLPDDS